VEILPVGRWLFNKVGQSHREMDGQTDIHDEFNSSLLKILRTCQKINETKSQKNRQNLISD